MKNPTTERSTPLSRAVAAIRKVPSEEVHLTVLESLRLLPLGSLQALGSGMLKEHPELSQALMAVLARTGNSQPIAERREGS
jgi:hypothetical protein